MLIDLTETAVVVTAGPQQILEEAIEAATAIGAQHDIVRFEPAAANWTVAEVDQIAQRAAREPFVRNIIIIAAADRLNRAADRLLTCVEEPPTPTTFIFSTHDTALLPTALRGRLTSRAPQGLDHDDPLVSQAILEHPDIATSLVLPTPATVDTVNEAVLTLAKTLKDGTLAARQRRVLNFLLYTWVAQIRDQIRLDSVTANASALHDAIELNSRNFPTAMVLRYLSSGRK